MYERKGMLVGKFFFSLEDFLVFNSLYLKYFNKYFYIFLRVILNEIFIIKRDKGYFYFFYIRVFFRFF